MARVREISFRKRRSSSKAGDSNSPLSESFTERASMSTICCDCRRNSFFGINSSRNSPDSSRSLIQRLIISSCRLTSRLTIGDVSCVCAGFSAAIIYPQEKRAPKTQSGTHSFHNMGDIIAALFRQPNYEGNKKTILTLRGEKQNPESRIQNPE